MKEIMEENAAADEEVALLRVLENCCTHSVWLPLLICSELLTSNIMDLFAEHIAKGK
jgi:Mg/Co/Ni transporter MgtE